MSVYFTKKRIWGRSFFLLIILIIVFTSNNYPQSARGGFFGDSTYIIWDAPQQISFDSYHSVAPQLVAVVDTLHLRWTTTNGPEVFYARSTNAGMIWSAPIVLDDTVHPATVNGGMLAADGKFAYLFWTRCETPCTIGNYRYVVELRRSVEAGAVWLERETIAGDQINTSNYNGYSAARDNTVGFINPRPGLSPPNRLGWSWDTGLNWNFYSINTGYDERFIILSNGIHLVQEGSRFGRPEVVYFYSSDFGSTWSAPIYISTTDTIISDIPKIDGDDNGNLYVVWRDGKYGSIGGYGATIMLRRSSNFGLTWFEEQILTPIPNGIAPSAGTEDEYIGVVWNNDITGAVVFRFSPDRGNTFSPVQELVIGGNPVIDISNGTVHTAWAFWPQGGTSQVFYRRGRIVTTGLDEPQPLPKSVILHQNYPNPFNSHTTIYFEIPERSFVKIKAYNILGQEIETLLSDVKEAGVHKVKYDGSRLKSGVYIFRLQTQKLNASRKFILIK